MNRKNQFRYKLIGVLALLGLLLLPLGALTTSAQNGEEITIDLVASNLAFDVSEITVPAGAQVTIAFDNQDEGIPHNFSLYTDASAAVPVFQGEIIVGVQTIDYQFTAPDEPGTYFFRCDAHPTTMTGQFIVH